MNPDNLHKAYVALEEATKQHDCPAVAVPLIGALTHLLWLIMATYCGDTDAPIARSVKHTLEQASRHARYGTVVPQQNTPVIPQQTTPSRWRRFWRGFTP